MATITTQHRTVYGNLLRGNPAMFDAADVAKIEALQALASADERVLVVEPSDYPGLTQVRLLSADEAKAHALAATSTEGLLTTFAALTHRMDEADRLKNIIGTRPLADLRTQRDAVRDEILRRTGDA